MPCACFKPSMSLFKAFLCLPVDVGKVCIQLAACKKIGVCNLAVLLQIVQMLLSPCAYF